MLLHRLARGCRVAGERHWRSVLYVIAVTLLSLAASRPAIATSGGAGTGAPPPPRSPHHVNYRTPSGVFSGRGMWIWILSRTNRGDLSSIIAQARHYGVRTLMIKSGDGSSAWSQFNSSLVRTLHANGLRACAWQYVYGNHPVSEAYVGAAAVKAGADCLLIDAESQYEGRYVAAQTYIQRLRSLIGQRFAVALAGFPYVDYHP